MIGNKAESGDGFVDINNLRFSFTADTQIKIQSGLPLEEIIQIDGQPATGVQSFNCANEGGPWYPFEVSLQQKHIKSLGDGESKSRIRCFISFDYLVDTGFERQPPASYNAVVVFDIAKSLGGYWLACDLGTSAIVVAFDKEVAHKEASLLPLQVIQEKRMKREKYDDYNALQIQEYSTPFLSSAVLLESGRAIDNLIFLAPNERRLDDPKYLLLPFLKALIGHEYIPHLGSEYDGFNYFLGPEPAKGSPVTPLNGATTLAQTPLKVDDVLLGVYDIILKEFVSGILSERRDIDGELNKAIFTIPNNFTPRHTDSIRRLIRIEFPEHFRSDDHILFISESDAVACYYLIKWRELNKGLTERIAQFAVDSEYVLIYDMGAGTLDLTYVKIDHKRDETGTKRIVNILGRMGIAIAGNYLDYAIARSVEQDVFETFEYDLFGSKPSPDERRFRDELRSHIREKVKPGLNDGNLPSYSVKRSEADVEREIHFDINKIRASNAIKEFLDKVTKEIFDTFFNLFNRQDGKLLPKGKFKINTVVFSGRASQLDMIHEAVEREINSWTMPLTNTHYITQFPNKNTLKSAVVQGALQFAAVYSRESSRVKFINRNIQACYGFVYRDDTNTSGTGWTFAKLLDPWVTPIKDKPSQKDGITIYEYNTDRYDTDSPLNDNKKNYIDLADAAEVHFVQSYSSNTEQDFSEGNMTYITVMFSLSVPEETGYHNTINKVPVRIVVDENNHMHVKIGVYTNEPVDPMQNQLIEDDTFVNGMWPRLEEIRKKN